MRHPGPRGAASSAPRPALNPRARREHAPTAAARTIVVPDVLVRHGLDQHRLLGQFGGQRELLAILRTHEGKVSRGRAETSLRAPPAHRRRRANLAHEDHVTSDLL